MTGRAVAQSREGSGVGVRRSVLHDAAGIALRVGEHHPGHIALTDVEVSYARPEQPLDFLGLAGPAKRSRWSLGGSNGGSGTRWKHRSSTGPPSMVGRVSKASG